MCVEFLAVKSARMHANREGEPLQTEIVVLRGSAHAGQASSLLWL